MPNRIIKESICTSDNIDSLSAFEETCFYRLMVNCDDFGRFDARAKILSSRLFPLKTVSPEQMQNALESLVKANLVTVYEVDGKPYLHLNSWEKHQQTRASKSKYPAPNESICYQMISDDSKCPRNRNRNRNTINDNRYSESLIGEDDAAKVIDEQNRVLDAAEDAGFKMSNDVRAALVALYADHGLQKMLDGFKSCTEHGVTNLAYLKAVLSGKPKKQEGFEQRDYSNDQQEAMDRLLEWGRKAGVTA